MADPRMEVVLGHGGDLARFADFFSSWLQDIDRMDGRRMLYIRDRDEVPYTILSQLEASSAVHVLRRRELENYLLEPEAISEALVQREVVDPGSVDPVTVRRLLREGADKLKMVAIVVGRLISVHQAVLRSLVLLLGSSWVNVMLLWRAVPCRRVAEAGRPGRLW
jgi:hypothetical protein